MTTMVLRNAKQTDVRIVRWMVSALLGTVGLPGHMAVGAQERAKSSLAVRPVFLPH